MTNTKHGLRPYEPPPLQMEPLFAHLVEQLHEPEHGRLDARRVADFFALPVPELARLIGHSTSSVQKTPEAIALQADLRPFERIASALSRLTGSTERARKWLHTASPALEGHAPIEMLQEGELGALESFLQDLLDGRPA